MFKRPLKSVFLVGVMGLAGLVLSGCQTSVGVGVGYGYGAPYYDAVLWNDYYHRRDIDADVDLDIDVTRPNRPDRPITRPNRPDRPITRPNRPRPPVSRPKPPRPPIHRPAGRPRLR